MNNIEEIRKRSQDVQSSKVDDVIKYFSSANDIPALLAEIDRLTDENEKLTEQINMAITDMGNYPICSLCKHAKPEELKCYNPKCWNKNCWEWRGGSLYEDD